LNSTVRSDHSRGVNTNAPVARFGAFRVGARHASAAAREKKIMKPGLFAAAAALAIGASAGAASSGAVNIRSASGGTKLMNGP